MSAAFAALMERGCRDVYQPDACWCGGMTEMVRIYELACSQGLRVCPHRGAEPWGFHALVGFNNAPLAETGRPWMEWVGGVSLERGEARCLNAPGFDVDFSNRF